MSTGLGPMTTIGRFLWVGRHLPTTLKPAIIFEVWSTLIFVMTFVPATGWVLDRLVASSGQYAVSDNDLVTFALSVPGLLFLLLTVGFTLTFWFAETAAMLLVLLPAIRGTRVSVSRVLWEMVKRLPDLLQLALRQGAVLLLVAIPFVGAIGLVYRLLLNEFDFYYYLNVQPASWWVAVAVVGALAATYLTLAAWLCVRWMLSIPALLFEGLPPRAALRKSWTRTRGRVWSLAVPLAAGWLVVLVSSAATTWLVSLAAARLVNDTESLTVLMPVVLGAVALLVLADLTWFIVGKILHVMLVTNVAFEMIGPDELTKVTTSDATRPLPVGLIRVGWIVASLALASAAIGATVGVLQRVSVERSLEITGHRGSKRRAPENTLAALRQAIREGADFAEIDVQTTADGVVVLLHDADLMRVASVSRRLNDMTYDELRGVDAGSWFDPEFRDERIPTLQEVIDLARGRIKLNIELKYTWADPDLADQVATLIRQNDFVAQCVVSSLNYEALMHVERAFPELTTGFIVFQSIGNLSRMDTDFLSISAARARPGLVRAVHGRGDQIHVWTVNDISNILSMIEMGVDNIITDEPALVRRVLEEWNELSGREKLALMLRNLIVDLEPPSDDL